MAENRLEARILLRYGTYSQWMNSDVILMKGEAAVCSFPRTTLGRTDDSPENTPPSIGIKIGDGVKYFDELPWVQGVAADVYSWAKASSKPTYTANEISGLSNYIASYNTTHSINSGGGKYRIAYNATAQKYILEIYNEQDQDWDAVTESTDIDLAAIYNRINIIERWANGARTGLGNIEVPIDQYILEEVSTYINKLDYTDTAIPHQFVTQVTESDGVIKVTRSIIDMSDLSGTLPTSQGGTGLTQVAEDEVLIGSANGNITTRKFATYIDDAQRNQFVTTGAIIDYVLEQTAGLTGAMHFIGEATVPVRANTRTNPQIQGYNFGQAQPGDVILANDSQELVWSDSGWILLGDEGSYAIKGSITNADIADEANIAQDKIYNLVETLERKVNVEEGKQLSTNDYSDEDKYKLDHIEENAQENVIEHIFINGNELPVITFEENQKSVNAIINEFDAASQTKLENIEAGAQVNVIEAISLNGKNQPPEEKRVSLTVSEFDDTSREKLAGIQAGAQVNVIEQVYVNGTEITPTGKRLDIPISQLTPEQAAKLTAIEEGAQVNIIEHITVDGNEILPDKATKTVALVRDPHLDHVNKIESIKLNDTLLIPDENKQVIINVNDAYKDQLTKLANIQDQAQVNTIETIALNGTALIHDNNKKVDIRADVNTIESISLNGDPLTPDNNKRVDIAADKNIIEGFTLNGTPIAPDGNKIINIEVRGFTSAELEKLEGISAGAEANVIEGIIYDSVRLEPDNNKIVRIIPNHHPEHENKIEKIYINNVEQEPWGDKSVHISITQEDLNLNVISGAEIPGLNNTKEEVPQTEQKLQLARISVTGDVEDLKQTNNTYIIFDCGDSTTVI